MPGLQGQIFPKSLDQNKAQVSGVRQAENIEALENIYHGMIEMKWPKCYVCGESTENRGYYEIKYIDEVYVLCGHHMYKVTEFIKNSKTATPEKKK